MPKITGSSTALSSLPTLPIPPYGLDTFTDFERGLSFTTLHFKHFGGHRETGPRLDLRRAGRAGGGRHSRLRCLRHRFDSRRRQKHEGESQVALPPQSADKP